MAADPAVASRRRAGAVRVGRPLRHLRLSALAGGVVVVMAAAALGLVVGPIPIGAPGALAEVVDKVAGLRLSTGLSSIETAVIWQIRARG